ncbi:MAG: ATPase [Alphaproteobacteria bacterium]|nr:ATPase [Alphaproteobacteria bacterium]
MTDPGPLKIAIASGKGGTGKTFLATTMAALLSETQKILLVDLDVEEPNDLLFFQGTTTDVIHQYKMIPAWDEGRCTHCGACTKNCNYHAVISLGDHITVFNELCHSCHACSELCPAGALTMTTHPLGTIKIVLKNSLTVIESRLEIGEEQSVPLIRQTHAFVDEYSHNIPVQIFDCPPGTSCPMVNSVKECDFVLLVTEPTPFGLNDLTLAVETIKQLEKPFGVVINREGTGNEDVLNYCLQEQIAVIGRIPYDRKIAECYSRGVLYHDTDPNLVSVIQQIIISVGKIIGKHE